MMLRYLLALLLLLSGGAAQAAYKITPNKNNTVDASQFAGSDMCAQIANAAVNLFSTQPAGGVIDATAFTGTQACAANMFSPWFGSSPTVPVGTYFPVLVLWGSATVTNAQAIMQLIPPWVQIATTLPNGGGSFTLQQVPVTAPAIVSPAYYVATTGSDASSLCTAGTLAAPFATWAHAETVAQGCSTKQIYIRAGVYTNTGSTNCSAFVISNGSASNGINVSYYPPDGPDTAIEDGNSSSGTTGYQGFVNIAGGNGIINGYTVNGIQFRNFCQVGVQANGFSSPFSTKVVVINNIIHDIKLLTGGIGIYFVNQVQNSIIANNYVYNTPNNGIDLQSTGTTGLVLNNDIVANNFLYNTCTNVSDCGGIYFQNYVTPLTTGVVIANNFLHDNGPLANVNRGLYLDDGTSNTYLYGNVVTGLNTSCFNIHGGANDTYTGNICDLGANAIQGILTIGPTAQTGTWPMTGNALNYNLIVSSTSGSNTNGGYDVNCGNIPAGPVIQHNAYYNYVGSSIRTLGNNCTGGTNDLSPVYLNPNFIGPNYSLQPNSLVFDPPTSFPPIVGNWGPPGFIIGQFAGSGTAPAYPQVPLTAITNITAAATQGVASATLSPGAQINHITTCASTNGVTAPPVNLGQEFRVSNGGANACNLWPQTGGTINAGAANAALSMPVNNALHCWQPTATNLYCVAAP